MTKDAHVAFPAETLAFLRDLRLDNSKAWFDANRHRYQAAYVEAAKDFVEAVAPVLEEIVPGIQAEPRVLGSIFRINRDTRFSSDKRPYKDHLDFWFWEGARNAAVSGLFLRVSPDGVGVGAGCHGFDKAGLARFRTALADGTDGAGLLGIVERIEAAGFEVSGETYRRVPPGYAVAEPVTRLLRHSSLYVHCDEPAELALDHDRLLPTLRRHWTAHAPLHRWLVTHVQPS